MKKCNLLANGMFQFFAVLILFTLSITSIQAQCISGLDYTYSLTSSASTPNQCTYTVNICTTVEIDTIKSISFSIANDVDTQSETVIGIFAVGQEVCQDLDIIVPECDVFAFVNIDARSSESECAILFYNGPLEQNAAPPPPPAPLAVEFAYLNGYQSKNEIVIEWITETETSNDYFEIEHSSTGRDFKFVENIDGAGNSSDAIAYKFLHQFPFNGLNYYRIKMVDFNNEVTYSNVISIELESKDVINVFPTTVDSELNIKMFATLNEVTNVDVFNSTGELMGSYIIPSGDNNLQIPTSNLIAGIYYVKIKLQGEGIITKPFIKKTM